MNQPDPTHGLSVQHADALWDAVAIPGPRHATFTEQHERVCRAVAAILVEVTASAAAVPAPQSPADRADLRDRIVAEVQRLHETGGVYALDAGEPERIADAVLAVLGEQPDRAAVLREAADKLAAMDPVEAALAGQHAWVDAANELRRLAVEAHDTGTQQPARCPHGCDVSRCPCLACEADDTEEQQEPSDEDVVEAHRLALSFALGLGTGAPWDAIDERVTELRRLAGEQPAQDEAPSVALARQAQERLVNQITEQPEVCQGFVWIGQPFTTCDRCARPAWEHDGEEVAVEGAGPFDTRRTVRPWKPGQADAIRAKWDQPTA